MRRLWQVSVVTTTEAEDAVTHLLQDVLGEVPAAYQDERTGAVTVTAYPERLTQSATALVSELKKRLASLRPCGLNLGRDRVKAVTLRRENWAESWKRHFHPIDIDHRLLIKPGWSRRRPRAGQSVVILDPGLSFGTGHHPTTLFCLEQLVRCRQPELPQSFLDIGSGSGILAISAAKLGYSPIAAWEYDPDALRTGRQNLKINEVQHQVKMVEADLRALPLQARRYYDVICANLMADLLLAEAKKVANLLAPRGMLIVAGILKGEFERIRRVLQDCGLTFKKSRVNKDWKSGVFSLKV